MKDGECVEGRGRPARRWLAGWSLARIHAEGREGGSKSRDTFFIEAVDLY